jgi:DNA invertase Pin-like site-specific DNA recombinase
MPDALIYNRVSTSDQDAEHQLPSCEELCRRRGLSFEVISETGKRYDQRRGWRHVLELARKRRIRYVVVWALDRIGGLWAIADTVRELDRLGVVLVSVEETWIETADPMIRDLLVRIFDWLAGWELKRLTARSKLAHATARRRGKPIGRPRVLVGTPLETALRLRGMGSSWQEIRKALIEQHAKKLPKSTIASAVTRLLEEMANAGAAGP